MEESDYYPFGLKILNYNMDYLAFQDIDGELALYPPITATGKLPNNYKYNGKELQNELGLNMYDYGARNYDPALGRWMNIDPLASKYFSYSPFTYALNNPVYFVDIDGMQVGDPGGGGGGGDDGKLWNCGDTPGGGVEITVTRTKKTSASGGGLQSLSFLSGLMPKMDLGRAVFGENLYKSYDKVFETENGRDFYKRLHKNDKAEEEIYVGALLFAAPELAMIGEFGSVSLIAEEIELLEAGQIAIKTVVEVEEAAVAISKGFKSFSAFKRVFGSAGAGQAWHHVVEQTPGNLSRFGGEAIHNTSNLMKLEHGAGSIHSKISGYYSSKQLFSGEQTVRQWLSTQSFQEQYNFGVETLIKFGGKL